jgi:hypothetical protein
MALRSRSASLAELANDSPSWEPAEAMVRARCDAQWQWQERDGEGDRTEGDEPCGWTSGMMKERRANDQ